MKKPKLTIELIPSTSHYTNVRTLLPASVWNRLRKESYKKANFKCEICKQSGLDQGFKHALECHEIWEYRDTTQILKGLVSLCPKCHMAKHVGRAIAIGKGKMIFKHIASVNKWTPQEVENYVGACFQDHKIKSKIKWTLNLKVLIEKYNVPDKIIAEGLKKKLPKTPPWKSKRKKKKKKLKRKTPIKWPKKK